MNDPINPYDTPSPAEPLLYQFDNRGGKSGAPAFQQHAAAMVHDLLSIALFHVAAGYGSNPDCYFVPRDMDHYCEAIKGLVDENGQVHVPNGAKAAIAVAAANLMQAMDFMHAGYHSDGVQFSNWVTAGHKECAGE